MRHKFNNFSVVEYTSSVGVYLFRTNKNFSLLEKLGYIKFVSQQSEGNIFTGVVSFCEATFFI